MIRPTAGAAIGLLLAGDADTLTQALTATLGGGTALASHVVKAGSRLAISSSPEPVSNVTASVVEDLVVLGLVAFALTHPVAAAVVAGVLLALGLVALYAAARVVRRGWRHLRAGGDRHDRGRGAPPDAGLPGPAR